MFLQLVTFVCFSCHNKFLTIGVHTVFYVMAYPFVFPVWVVGLCFSSSVSISSLLGILIFGLF